MISSTYLKRQSIMMNPKAGDVDKKIASVLFNDQADGVSSRDLNAIAALTFNPKPAEDIYRILTGSLMMQQNTWQTLLKGLIIVNHLVRFGAERCVDHSWDIIRLIESLENYNSALIKTAFGSGGRDNGLPVRQRAGPLIKLLNSPDDIRKARLENQDNQGAICPGLGTDDYTAKGGGIIAFGADTMAVNEQRISVEKDNSAFGSEAGKTLAAKFDLSHVPGMYEGRPDRFFDDVSDVRNHRAAEDSHITRNALAPDLLDLDFGGQVVSTEFPSDGVPNLAQSLNEQKLQAQLKAQQEQLEMLQAAMQGGAQGQGNMQGQGGMQGMGAHQGQSMGGNQGMGGMQTQGGTQSAQLDLLSLGTPVPPQPPSNPQSTNSMQGMGGNQGQGGNQGMGGMQGQGGNQGMGSMQGQGGMGGNQDASAQLRQLEMLRAQLAQQEMLLKKQGGQQ